MGRARSFAKQSDFEKEPTPGKVRPVPAIVSSSFQPTNWTLDDGRLVLEPIPRLRLSSFLMVRDAAIAGAGAGAALIPQSIDGAV